MSHWRLHENAARGYDERAKSLIKMAETQLFDDLRIKHQYPVIENGPRGPIRLGLMLTDRRIALEGEALLALGGLVSDIVQKKPLRGMINRKFVENSFTHWWKNDLESKAETSFIATLKRHFDEHVKPRTFVIPIEGLEIAEDICIGEVTFKSTRKAQLSDSKPVQHALKYCSTVGFVDIIAEVALGHEKAKEKVEEALDYLRFFLSRFWLTNRTSGCVCRGNSRSSLAHFLYLEGSRLHSIEKAVPFTSTEVLPIDTLEHYAAMGLQEVATLAKVSTLNDFQESILHSIRWISKAALEESIDTRLLYTFGALESFFLGGSRDDSIMATVGERFSFTVGRRPADRESAFRNFRHVYGLRSNFVHHAQRLGTENSREVETLLKNARTVFIKLLKEQEHWPSREIYFDAIKVARFSGTIKKPK